VRCFYRGTCTAKFRFARRSSRWSLLKFLAIFAAICLTSPYLPAQQEKSVPATQHPLETKTELVKLDVTVLDTQGNFVDGLEEKNFRVLDAGVERPISFFAPVTAPASVVIILETSPAVYLFQDEHIAAAYSLLGGLADDDQIALVSYSDVPKSVVSFTTNKSELLNALNGNVQYTMGMASLNLYDSISAVIDGIAALSGKKALVLLTTGLDSSPPERWDALTQKLQRADVVIFSVGLGQSLAQTDTPKPKPPKRPKPDSNPPNDTPLLDQARNALISLSTMTGGRAYFPESGKDFAPAYREIASSLRHQYVLGIVPGHDGEFHTLNVDVLDANGKLPKTKHHQPEYRVSARQGYIAPAP